MEQQPSDAELGGVLRQLDLVSVRAYGTWEVKYELWDEKVYDSFDVDLEKDHTIQMLWLALANQFALEVEPTFSRLAER